MTQARAWIVHTSLFRRTGYHRATILGQVQGASQSPPKNDGVPKPPSPARPHGVEVPLFPPLPFLHLHAASCEDSCFWHPCSYLVSKLLRIFNSRSAVYATRYTLVNSNAFSCFLRSFYEWSKNVCPRSLSELLTTNTLEKAMAAAANMGSRPPSMATGISTML